jgi:iron complex transport system substrate-binding protein
MRVVSLLPSATELCYAVGVAPVGVSHSCDYPPAARDVPAVTSTSVAYGDDRTAAEIDDQMQATDGSVYELDAELLAALDPDVVVTQATCDVCAVDETDVRAVLADRAIDAEVVTLDPDSLSAVLDDVERVGRALDRAEAAGAVAASLRDRVRAIESRARPGTEGVAPRVAVLDWTDPVMVAGHWIPGMVDRVGGRYGLADPGVPSRPVEWADVRAYDPEVFLVAPCGFTLDRAATAVDTLRDRPGFSDLAAVRRDRVYALDGRGHVNRPGPRLVDTLAAMAACLHPERLDADPSVVRHLTPVPPA